MKVSKFSMILVVVVLFLALINVYQYIQISHLENDKSYYQRQIEYLNEDIELYTKPLLRGINMGFSGENFVGIVCNMGYDTAYDAKLVLYTDTWSYKILLGDIEGYQFVEFDEYVPTPPESGDIRNMYLVKFEYSDTPQ